MVRGAQGASGPRALSKGTSKGSWGLQSEGKRVLEGEREGRETGETAREGPAEGERGKSEGAFPLSHLPLRRPQGS